MPAILRRLARGTGAHADIHDRSTSIRVMSKTGLASVKAADDNRKLYAYYQDPEGNIHETMYFQGKWGLEAGESDSLVTTAARSQSSLAAVSFQYDGQTYRQLFFFTPGGSVKSVKRTGTSVWGDPVTLDIWPAKIDSIALAACASTEFGIYGIRIFYANQYEGCISQLGTRLDGSGLATFGDFANSDDLSGVACSFHKEDSLTYLNLYYRKPQTRRIHQEYQYAGDDPKHWRHSKVTYQPHDSGAKH